MVICKSCVRSFGLQAGLHHGIPWAVVKLQLVGSCPQVGSDLTGLTLGLNFKTNLFIYLFILDFFFF